MKLLFSKHRKNFRNKTIRKNDRVFNQDKTKNRGFAFVEYSSHRDAAMARRKLMTGKIQLWGHQIAVDWAEPEQEVDEEIMDQVRFLFTVRRYPK